LVLSSERPALSKTRTTGTENPYALGLKFVRLDFVRHRVRKDWNEGRRVSGMNETPI